MRKPRASPRRRGGRADAAAPGPARPSWLEGSRPWRPSFRRARLGPRTPWLVQASGSQLPFRDGVFDRSFLVTVLGEIPDKRGALAEQARVLRPQFTQRFARP